MDDLASQLIPSSELEIEKEIGRGAYGVVFKGILNQSQNSSQLCVCSKTNRHREMEIIASCNKANSVVEYERIPNERFCRRN